MSGTPNNFFHKQIVPAEEELKYWKENLEPHYLSTGAIKRIPAPSTQDQYVSKAFFVVKTSGGYRLVVDLRFINQYFPE